MTMTSRAVTLLLFLLGAALIVALGVLVLGGGEDELSLNPGEPEIASFDQLAEVASGSETQPLYWVGQRDGVEYEVTKTRGGRYYVRYLEDGAEAGDERPDFVTVGTYPSKDGVGDLREARESTDGAELGRTDDGAVLLIDPTSVKSVHLAYPGGDSQIEIYSPVPGQALRIAERGEVEPIQ
jgi:hypothetical protein